jgi:hypothetical protein
VAKRKKTRKGSEDPQQWPVYKWEGTWTDFNRKTLSLAGCRQVVKRACRAYGVRAPRVFAGPIKAKWAYYHSLKHHISLNSTAMNIAIALHEAAHAIVHTLAPRATDHGPTFLGVYLDLLGSYYPASALESSARKASLRWDNRLVSQKKKARG